MNISVVVTSFNYGNYLGRCIRSLVDQSLSRDQYEIIVVDDASTDQSPEVMKSFSGFIRPIYNESNLGLAETCNIGLRRSLGRLIVRVDADDYVHRDFLLVSQLYLLQNYQLCDAVALDYLEVDEQEEVLDRRNAQLSPIACGITFKMDALTKIGLYKTGLRFNEDVELMQRFLSAGLKLAHLPLPLYRYKRHPVSLTARTREVGAYDSIQTP